jgi:ABC-type nitrate/sulfonate/bicarbonate transport system substrate-binding protein
VPHLERLAAAFRLDDEGRDRGDDLDRALRHARREDHGTEVASDRVDAETYAAFNRAVREAVRRINANKRAYLRYFIDYHAKTDKEIAALRPEDLRESRIVVVDPAPIPLDEMQRTYDWLKSWGMLEETATPLKLVDLDVQQRAHATAAE